MNFNNYSSEWHKIRINYLIDLLYGYCNAAYQLDKYFNFINGLYLDEYNDDLPFWSNVNGVNHLVVPYTLDANDMRFATAQGFNSGDQFLSYITDAFDVLY